MKLIFISIICFSMLLSNINSHKKVFKSKLNGKSSHQMRKATNTTYSNDTVPKNIDFRKEASFSINNKINSVGEKVDVDVYLKTPPFQVTRCDQVVYFPCGYINNRDDYRVRKKGFLAITAHFTNLYAQEDGQKLIDHILSAPSTTLPNLIKGADGCFIVYSSKEDNKQLYICTPTVGYAKNILEVYKTFRRCLIGDNLTRVSQRHVNKLLGLCRRRRSSVEQEENPYGMVKADGVKQNKSETLYLKDKKDGISYLRSQRKRKKLKEFELPPSKGNKWEDDRLSYFSPNRLKVPGDADKFGLPAGLEPGLLSTDNPGKAPKGLS